MPLVGNMRRHTLGYVSPEFFDKGTPLNWTISDTTKDIIARWGFLGNCYLNGELYCLGGSTGGNFNASNLTTLVESYNPSTGLITSYSSDPLPTKFGIAVTMPAQYNGADVLYVFGGYNGSSSLDTIYRFDPAQPSGSRWSTSGTTLPIALHNATIAKDESNQVIYIIGGVNGSTYKNTIYAFHYNTETFTTTLADYPGTARRTGIAGYWDGKVYFIGGISSTGVYQRTNSIYDVVTDSWSTGTQAPISYSYPNYAQSGAYIYQLGGVDGGGGISAGYRYNILTDDYNQIGGLVISLFASSIGIDPSTSKIYLAGGFRNGIGPNANVYKGTIV